MAWPWVRSLKEVVVNRRAAIARIAGISVVIVGLLVCPSAVGARAAIPPRQIPFTPNILPLLVTPTPVFSGFNPLSEGLARVEGNMLWV